MTLQRGGEIFVSNAVIGGRYALRACIVNFHTTAADVEARAGHRHETWAVARQPSAAATLRRR